MAIKSLAQTLKDLTTGIKNTVTTVNKISDIMNIQSGLNPDGSSNGKTPGTPTAGATDNTTDHNTNLNSNNVFYIDSEKNVRLLPNPESDIRWSVEDNIIRLKVE